MIAALGIVVPAIGVTTAAIGPPAATATGAPSTTRSTTGTSFSPGLIISDDSFYNYQSMSRAAIQSFLERRACTPKPDAPCLAQYRADTHSIPTSGPGHCAAFTGRHDEPASSIIARVAAACIISPRVLIVLLQKEQSLVTAPTASGYLKATGYGCPDTADCNAKYLGFFNQVYRAAWQFREYTLHPGEWRYRIGSVPVQFSPKVTCGASTVHIGNQATANLYNYTPYQPNAQTLRASASRAGSPQADAGPCAAFGNLNFSRIFSGWFGSPLAQRYPAWLESCLDFFGGIDCPPLDPLSPERAP